MFVVDANQGFIRRLVEIGPVKRRRLARRIAEVTASEPRNSALSRRSKIACEAIQLADDVDRMRDDPSRWHGALADRANREIHRLRAKLVGALAHSKVATPRISRWIRDLREWEVNEAGHLESAFKLRCRFNPDAFDVTMRRVDALLGRNANPS